MQVEDLLYSESLTVRERALLGKASASEASSRHWDEDFSKQRVMEVMGRMAGAGSGKALLEKLLLRGL